METTAIEECIVKAPGYAGLQATAELEALKARIRELEKTLYDLFVKMARNGVVLPAN